MPDRYLGQTLGKYRVTRLLGAGAYAWVYEAIDQDLDIPVALKILRPEFAGQNDSDVRFRREAATAARLRHRNIVTVRDVGQIDHTAFVVMDWYPLTLGRRLVAAGRLPESECVRIGLDVAAALAIAHAGGVVHRDIKPDNILISREGDAVVADFGLARALTGALAGATALSATNRILGTPHYFSPEQARGHEVDGRSDLYALGVTLYRASTGHLPFEGEDWYAVARHHIETAPTPPRVHVPELTPAFESVILTLLAKEPTQRFQTATQLLDALGALPTAWDRARHPIAVSDRTADAWSAVPATQPWSKHGTAAALFAVTIVVAMLWYAATAHPRPRLTAGRPTSALSADSPTAPPAARAGRPPNAMAAPPAAPPETIGTPHARARPAITARAEARLDLIAPDSARLYVDNRLVGTGRWTGIFPPGARVVVRAVLAHAATNCDAAVRDTTILLTSRGRMRVSLPVRGCVAVSVDVTPRDARVLFTPLDGGRRVELRADSARALSLPEGRYQLRMQAPRCVTGTDTITVAPTANGMPITRRFPLICS